MTITLHDVYYILGLPIAGLSCTNLELPNDNAVIQILAELFEEEDVETVKGSYCKGNVVELSAIAYKLKEGRVASDHAYAILYLWYLLSCTLFVDKSGNKASLSMLKLVANFQGLGHMALGAGVLAYLYRNLGISSRRDCRQLGGCMTLLEAWIYEYFPPFRQTMCHSYQRRSDLPLAMKWDTTQQTCPPSSSNDLKSYRLRLDSMKKEEVFFMPINPEPEVLTPQSLYHGSIHFDDIIESYMPDRVIRQFGYKAIIPQPPIEPAEAKLCRHPNLKKYNVDYTSCGALWQYCGHHLIHLDESRLDRCVYPSDARADYLPWFQMVSHPYVHPRHVDEEPANWEYMQTDTELRRGLMGGLRYWFKQGKKGVSKEVCYDQMQELYFQMGGLTLTSSEEEEGQVMQEHSLLIHDHCDNYDDELLVV